MGCVLEAKHVGGREPVEITIERYQPQMQWQMFVTGAQQVALSIIRGADEPIVEFVDRDDAYIAEMLKRAIQFMKHVREGTPPVILPPAPPPISKWIDYNMAGNDVWRRFAEQWLQTKGAADSCEEASKVLKSLVPADARKCWGDGVRISRDRAGRLSLRIDA